MRHGVPLTAAENAEMDRRDRFSKELYTQIGNITAAFNGMTPLTDFNPALLVNLNSNR